MLRQSDQLTKVITALLKRELSKQRSLVGVAIKSAAELCPENQCTGLQL